MDSNVSLCVFIKPYASLCVLMCLYGFIEFVMHLLTSSGSLWVLINPYAFLLVLMGSFKSFCILMDSNGSL